MKILKRYVFTIDSEDEMFKVQTILEQFNVAYECNVDELSGEGIIQTYSDCPDECIDMLEHCV